MAGLWEGITDLASSGWEQVQGGVEQWVGIEIDEELDRLNDSSYNRTSQPGEGHRTTGSAPPTDGARTTASVGGGGGGGVSLQTAAAVAGILASAIVVYSFATR